MSKRKLPSMFDVLGLPQAASLRSADKLVLVYLAWRQGKNEAAWPSLQTIANDLRINYRTCLRIITRLHRAGCVEKVSGRAGRGHSNRYIIVTEKQGPVDTVSARETVVPVSHETVSPRPLEVQGSTVRGSTARKPSSRRGRDSQKRTSKTPGKPFVPPIVDDVQDYAESRGDRDFNAGKFVEWYSKQKPPWTDSNGKPVRDWKGKVRWWIDKDNQNRIERGEPPHDGYSQYGTHPASEEEVLAALRDS